MSETNEHGTEKGGRERAPHTGTFPTLQEARQIKPPSDKFRLYLVTDPNGQQVYTWGKHGYGALVNAAQQDGYRAEVAEAKGALTKERVAAKLAELTDEELAEMGLARKKSKR